MALLNFLPCSFWIALFLCYTPTHPHTKLSNLGGRSLRFNSCFPGWLTQNKLKYACQWHLSGLFGSGLFYTYLSVKGSHWLMLTQKVNGFQTRLNPNAQRKVSGWFLSVTWIGFLLQWLHSQTDPPQRVVGRPPGSLSLLTTMAERALSLLAERALSLLCYPFKSLGLIPIGPAGGSHAELWANHSGGGEEIQWLANVKTLCLQRGRGGMLRGVGEPAGERGQGKDWFQGGGGDVSSAIK